jgi:hypothetical protein
MRIALGVVVALAVAPLWLGPMGAQTPSGGSPQKPAVKPAEPAPPFSPKTPWGAPNLQGTFISGDLTPVETPDPSDQKSLSALSRWFPGNDFTTDRTATTDPVVKYPPSTRRSLVTDPPTGRLLIKQSAIDERDYKLNNLNDTYENHTLWERCISRGAPLLPAPYDSAYQILQTPNEVAIYYELLHAWRIIPISAAPHLTSNIRQWFGDSRGRWEGQALVVDTTNFRDKTILGSATTSRRLRGLPHSESLHTIERFTRIDAGTIRYEVRIQDPKTYDSDWTAVVDLLTPPASYQLLESACHEGNEYLPTALRGARVEEGALPSLRR